MTWDYELAQEIKKRGKPPSGTALLEGTVVKTAPLTISLYGGEIMAPPMKLEVTASAPGYELSNHTLYLHQWQEGERVACALMGKTLVVLGRLV